MSQHTRETTEIVTQTYYVCDLCHQEKELHEMAYCGMCNRLMCCQGRLIEPWTFDSTSPVLYCEACLSLGVASIASFKKYRKLAHEAWDDWKQAVKKSDWSASVDSVVDNRYKAHVAIMERRKRQEAAADKLRAASKKVVQCFPNHTDAAEFDIPGYIIRELEDALEEKL